MWSLVLSRHCWAGTSLQSPPVCFSSLASRSHHLCVRVCVSTLHLAAASAVFTCRRLITCRLCRAALAMLCCAVLWLVGSCAPQLLIDLSEYVSLTSPAAPVLAQTGRQPPKPPPVSTRAPAAELVSSQTDQLDRPVRTCSILHVCLITNTGGET